MIEGRTVPETHKRTLLKDKILIDLSCHLPAHIEEVRLIRFRHKIHPRLHRRGNSHKNIPAEFQKDSDEAVLDRCKARVAI